MDRGNGGSKKFKRRNPLFPVVLRNCSPKAFESPQFVWIKNWAKYFGWLETLYYRCEKPNQKAWLWNNKRTLQVLINLPILWFLMRRSWSWYYHFIIYLTVDSRTNSQSFGIGLKLVSYTLMAWRFLGTVCLFITCGKRVELQNLKEYQIDEKLSRPFVSETWSGLGKGSASWRFFFAVKVKSLKKKCYVHRP